MKTSIRNSSFAAGLSLAAAILSASATATAGQGGVSVGDLAGFSDEPAAARGSDADDTADAAGDGLVSHVGDLALPGRADRPDRSSAPRHGRSYSPVSHSDLQPHSMPHHVGSELLPMEHYNLGCDGSCDGGCDSGCGGIGGLMDRCDTTWAKAELLLWFADERHSPPLVTTAGEGVAPELDQEGSQVAFGGELGGDVMPGFRIDAGRYLTKRFGIGGRFWILGEDSDPFSISGNAAGQSIGRPFFNTNLPGQGSVLVAFASNFEGSVAAESQLDLLAAEAYGRLMIGCSKDHRVDLIGGYSYFDIDDRLTISSTTRNIPGTGTANNFSDVFDAENEFHGGQFGLETSLNRGCWTLTSLTKVHLGNAAQRIRIEGSSSVVTTVPTTTTFGGGLLALDNQDIHERDEFTFVPEVNLNLAYRFRPNVLLSVGYSFLYFDNVLLAGEHVDPVFDGSTLLTDGPYGQRDFTFDESSLWVQGIDLGVVLDF